MGCVTPGMVDIFPLTFCSAHWILQPNLRFLARHSDVLAGPELIISCPALQEEAMAGSAYGKDWLFLSLNLSLSFGVGREEQASGFQRRALLSSLP